MPSQRTSKTNSSRTKPYQHSPRNSQRNSLSEGESQEDTTNCQITLAKRQESFARRIMHRTTSFSRKQTQTLPKNWKIVHDKDNSTYYFNSVTHQRSKDPPRELPQGWTASLHKESGRVCYTNKTLRKTSFEFPELSLAEQATENDEKKRGSKTDEAATKEGFITRTISRFSKPKNLDLKPVELTQRFNSFSRKPRLKDEKSLQVTQRFNSFSRRARPGSENAKSSDNGQQRRIHISCSALIREIKLCVETGQQSILDSLLESLSAKEMTPQLAVKRLIELVGSVLVQQAGLSITNARKGILPHGWLEYADESSNRSYFYNVHTRETTWIRPKMPEKIQAAQPIEESSDNYVDIECDVAITGFI